MRTAERRTPPASRADESMQNGRGAPAWQVAQLFPCQGEWTELDYRTLESNSDNRMIELVNGFLEVLPVPDLFHQRITQFLYRELFAHTAPQDLGEVFVAPCPIRLWPKHLREPDVFFLKPHRIKDPHEPPDGADLAIEVVSAGPENRERDLQHKRRDYAKAKIAEYWIVDPEVQTITVLFLSGKSYKTHGVFKPADKATSRLLSGFAVDVAAVFAAGGLAK